MCRQDKGAQNDNEDGRQLAGQRKCDPYILQRGGDNESDGPTERTADISNATPHPPFPAPNVLPNGGGGTHASPKIPKSAQFSDECANVNIQRADKRPILGG